MLRTAIGERRMKTAIVYVLAALAEIAGCSSFWAWLRLDKTIYWLIPGMVALAAFAYFFTLIDSVAAGRAYAAYGGVYIVASLFWLWAFERMRPDHWDAIGASVALLGAPIIIFGPRG